MRKKKLKFKRGNMIDLSKTNIKTQKKKKNQFNLCSKVKKKFIEMKTIFFFIKSSKNFFLKSEIPINFKSRLLIIES